MKGMKLSVFKGTVLLLLSVYLLSAGKWTAFAAEEYTYTVRLYAGNKGELKEGGIQVSSGSAEIRYEAECTVVTGLKYGDTVYIRPQDTVEVTEGKYYVKGVRRSGRDNSEAETPTFHVACDRDYVVAYGIKGDQVAYRVDYVDVTGRSVLESETYYGNVGERQYVSSRYVEGYQPQALNLVKTLSENEAENVFEFRYLRSLENAQPGTEEGGAGNGEGTGTGTGDNEGAGEDGEGAGDTDVPGAGGGQDPEGTGTGGDAAVENPGGEGQQELEDLDDEQVPLANAEPEKSHLRMGNLPIFAGVGAMDILVLAAAAVYLALRRKKALAVVGKDEKREKK